MSDEDDKRYWLKINRTRAHPVGRGRGRAPGLRPRGGAHPRAVAGLNAYAKGKSLGLFEPAPEEVNKKEVLADVCRMIPPLNAPFHHPLTEGLTEIEVTDARHPRRFPQNDSCGLSHLAVSIYVVASI